MYIIDGTATFNLDELSEDDGEMNKIGDIRFYKYYTSLKEMNESLLSKEEEEDLAANKVSLKIGNKKVFEVVKLTPSEAKEVRKALPQLI